MQKRVREEAGWRVLELKAAHDAVISAPRQLAETLLSCAGQVCKIIEARLRMPKTLARHLTGLPATEPMQVFTREHWRGLRASLVHPTLM